MIEFLRNFLGEAPIIRSIYDIPALSEYMIGAILLLAVMLSVYAIFGNLIKFFRRN